ncbi:hypothetical protein ACN9MB_01290 [Dyella kyungheensis]|uniref:hypothetical protein n=1 Tax=Dyella kyungheensis TaxID=1242174 RepID=UPI003CF736A4
MQKIDITQEEIDQGNGRFHEYMGYVRGRLAMKNVEPKDALFGAARLILQDGHKVALGSEPDDAALAVSNWLSNFYGDRENVSYCFPSIAYQINGAIYLLRMPIVRTHEISLLNAVIALTEESAKRMSDRQFERFQSEYNEFYTNLYTISRFDVTTVIHLESAADRLCIGAAHNALSRWESLHFVERAMKEVLQPKGIELKGSDGHDVSGALHRAWVGAGLPHLPEELLRQVMCPPAIRYQKSPHPFLAAINAHHASIRLGALIAKEIPGVPRMKNTLQIEQDDLAREGVLAIARVYPAMDPESDNWPSVKLIRLP